MGHFIGEYGYIYDDDRLYDTGEYDIYGTGIYGYDVDPDIYDDDRLYDAGGCGTNMLIWQIIG